MEHLNQKQQELLDELIIGQMRVVSKIQSHILSGEIGSKDSAYIDNCGRIHQLVVGLGYLIGAKSGRLEEDSSQQENENICYPPVD